MRNCNWMTKLKRIKTSINRKGTKQEIHRMKNEIKKQEMKRAIVYITSQERKKREKIKQLSTTIHHHQVLHITPKRKGHDNASRKTKECQLHWPGGVSCAAWMAWTLPTCWGMLSMRLSIKKFEKNKMWIPLTCWGMPSMCLSIKKFEKTKIPQYPNNHSTIHMKV